MGDNCRASGSDQRQRFGLHVLSDIATIKHIHLLVQDRGSDVNSGSMELAAAHTAQQYNHRKTRRGALSSHNRTPEWR